MPAEDWANGRTGRDGTGPRRRRAIRRGRYRAAGHELRCPAGACGRGCRYRGAFGQRRARIRRGSGRSLRRPSSGTLSRPARPEPSLHGSTRRRQEGQRARDARRGTRQQAGADQERPAAITAATAGTPLQITCPRRSPGPAVVTAKTPKNGLEITADISSAGIRGQCGAWLAGLCLTASRRHHPDKGSYLRPGGGTPASIHPTGPVSRKA
jgi:hypothetical protein